MTSEAPGFWTLSPAQYNAPSVFVVSLTDPQVNVVEEEASQNLVQGPIHLQPSRSSHQPLQQLIQLFGHMLQKKHNLMVECCYLESVKVAQNYCFALHMPRPNHGKNFWLYDLVLWYVRWPEHFVVWTRQHILTSAAGTSVFANMVMWLSL